MGLLVSLLMPKFRINGCMNSELKSWNNLIKLDCILPELRIWGGLSVVNQPQVSPNINIFKKDSRLQISIVEFVLYVLLVI